MDAATAAPGDSYVALGDSYSSGTGTRDYLADGTSCQRSARAYPSLIASARGLDLNFRACSGATTADVTSAHQLDDEQIDALKKQLRARFGREVAVDDGFAEFDVAEHPVERAA